MRLRLREQGSGRLLLPVSLVAWNGKVEWIVDTDGMSMGDSIIKKVSVKSAPRGAMGQTYLVSGKRVAMRLWRNEQPHEKQSDRRAYETVGYVISGKAELSLEGQVIKLDAGDSWLVPADAEHRYRIIEPFTAIEATAPPAQVRGRDED